MGKQWTEEVLGTKKPIIAMFQIRAMPRDSGYDPSKGIDWIIDNAIKNLTALQEDGVDAVIFSNEFSIPTSSGVNL